MQPSRIAIMSALIGFVLLVSSGVACASEPSQHGLSSAPLSTAQLVVLTAVGFLPLLFMLLRERRRSDSPLDE